MKAIGIVLFLLVAAPASLVDIRERRIPNALVVCGLILAAGAAAIPPVTIGSALLGGGAGFLLFLAVWYLSRGGMGMGDVKYAAFVGTAAGIAGLPIAIFVSSVLGLLVALALVLLDRASLRLRIPYAPFLSAGGLAALLSQAFHWPAPLMGGLR